MSVPIQMLQIPTETLHTINLLANNQGDENNFSDAALLLPDAGDRLEKETIKLKRLTKFHL